MLKRAATSTRLEAFLCLLDLARPDERIDPHAVVGPSQARRSSPRVPEGRAPLLLGPEEATVEAVVVCDGDLSVEQLAHLREHFGEGRGAHEHVVGDAVYGARTRQARAIIGCTSQFFDSIERAVLERGQTDLEDPIHFGGVEARSSRSR